MIPVPRIVVAGTHSGCGKTTIASGIMAALTARGLKVQPFKVGPDFIDPSHHTRICGRISRNLDPFMMGERGCEDTFFRAAAGADIAVIEGVMGMYDGVDGTDLASTAHIARILQAPVVLVVDAKGMSGSVHALVDGYRHFDPTLKFAGVIFNRIGSIRHRSMIERSLAVPAFGYIPRREDLAVESRHLGLKMAHEAGTMGEFGRIIEETCDLDALKTLADRAGLRKAAVKTHMLRATHANDLQVIRGYGLPQILERMGWKHLSTAERYLVRRERIHRVYNNLHEYWIDFTKIWTKKEDTHAACRDAETPGGAAGA